MLRRHLAHTRTLDAAEYQTYSERKKRIYSFLMDNPVGVLSMVTPDGEPHGVVIYFAVDKDFRLSFLTKSATRKYDNLVRNNHCMLTVFDPETQKVAQVIGKAVEIKDGRRLNAVAGEIWGTSIRFSESGMPPLTKLDAGQYAAFQICPVQIRMASYSRPDVGKVDQMFESIESFNLREDCVEP